MIRSPRGTNDILPNEINKWHYLEEAIRKITSRYGYAEIRTPIFESTEVFSRSIGDTSDIVNKEMYTFMDRGENSITLRPEMTAALVRACIQNSLANRGELERLWYYGPFFRYERPQKGRFRQFHQFGAECLSSPNPESDAEVILLAHSLITDLGINEYTLNINSLGNSVSRDVYRENLVKYFSKYEGDLSDDSVRRLASNPLRILDSKDPKDIEIATEAPQIIDSLDSESRAHFDSVLNILESINIKYNISSKLVRGLDYYSHTVFEFQSNALGSQDSFGGGGRYDGLFEQLGGKFTPAVGFALGVERILLIIDSLNKNNQDNSIDFYIITGEEEYIYKAFEISNTLRNQGYKVVSDIQRKSFKSQMKDANKYNAYNVIILAEREMSVGNFTLKNMESGEQQQLSIDKIDNISEYIK
ncbi:MAG: histidine--tRNA ligase [Ignavibacteriae bacterium HGW-Ignavibacteriae-4]|jgi:histidyl-tRNA synthetase|nr:MAG: histidine--tRNA ligase [Ignavibacteriae bacterium HGW-Ignavibacteriae-4]